MILQELGEATTGEMINRASKISKTCRDRIPAALLALVREGKIIRFLSKEKKGIVWKLNV